MGVLIFVSSLPASPVGVSDPRATHVTLPASGQTSSTTTTTSSSRSSSRASTSVTSQSPQAANELDFSPITAPAATRGYDYGEGGGAYSVIGGSVYFSLGFTDQNPRTHFSLVLSVNGTARTIGNYTTNANGGASVGASTELGTGRFVLSLTVFDLSSFDQPTATMETTPSTFIVNAYGTSVSTTLTATATAGTTTSGPSAPEAPGGPEWAFQLVPASLEFVPTGYRLVASGTALVSLDAEYSLLNVQVGFQGANPSTTYTAALLLNGTSVNLGTMTTSKSGGADLRSSIQVRAGTYLMGLTVFDISNIAALKASGPVPVMVTSPVTELAVIPPSAGSTTTSTTSSSASESSTTQTAVTSTVTETVTTLSAGVAVQAQIQNAVDNLTIPATVQVTPLSSFPTVLDSRFSLSVGQQVSSGLVIAISGENVTGPRVLLINMSRTDPLALYPALNVTLDGDPVAEASSALQVLNPTSTNPPMYVLVATSTRSSYSSPSLTSPST